MPKLRTRKVWGGFFPEYELRRRETGFNCNLGWEGNLKYSLYSSLHPCNSWDPIFSAQQNNGKTGAHHGGIFNFEFSPDGRQLVAACEKKAIMIFDPLTRKQIYDVAHAHTSCVNGIKFLDNRVFATCSDDKTVALWDVRNLSRKIVRLYGHNNWVKNIEYSSDDGLLVTSGFDGRILGWNINRYTEDSAQCSELFSMHGLMRMRLTPDLTKLIICTTEGYMVVVHNLSLKDLAKDLKDFKPNVYRLMQISSPRYSQTTDFSNLFYRKQNRIEFISDFPPGNDAEVIHSLQVHPQGWCALSRNTSTGDSSEWTCVHDIQEQVEELKEKKDLLEDNSVEPNNANTAGQNANDGCHPFYVNSNAPESSNLNEQRMRDLRFTISRRLEVRLRETLRGEEDEEEDEDDDDNVRNRGGSTINSGGSTINSGAREVVPDRGPVVRPANFEDSGFDFQLRFTSMGVFEALEHIELRRMEERRLAGAVAAEVNAGPSGMSDNARNGADSVNGNTTEGSQSPHQDFRLRRRRDTESGVENNRDYRSVFFIRPGLDSHRSILVLPPWNTHNMTFRAGDKATKIPTNAQRLTNYIEDSNKGKGFIKELCFSSDGRLICSPYDCGVRLMMFDEKCSELSHCVQKTPQQLHAISNNICHTNCVVSTKFSPVDCLLVSGCLNGNIVWHQPII